MNITDKLITCPHCGALLDKYTLYSMDLICMDCGIFIDLDRLEENMGKCNSYESSRCWEDDDYWDDYGYGSNAYGYNDRDDYYKDDYYYEYMARKEKDKEKEGANVLPVPIDEENDPVSTWIIRFITKETYDTIQKSFEQIDGSIDYLEVLTNGPIRKYLETTGGQKLCKGLNINPDDVDEYKAVISFFIDDNEDKKALISTLCKVFPLCSVREEESSYIMANNKGYAKGIVDMANEDEVEILCNYMTGYEKYKVLSTWLYFVSDEYKSVVAKDIYIMWRDNSLISLDALRTVKEVPIEWQEFLDGEESIMVSKDARESGTLIYFEKMLEEVIDSERKKKTIGEEPLINVISLRGTADFAIGADGEEITDENKGK